MDYRQKLLPMFRMGGDFRAPVTHLGAPVTHLGAPVTLLGAPVTLLGAPVTLGCESCMHACMQDSKPFMQE